MISEDGFVAAFRALLASSFLENYQEWIGRKSTPEEKKLVMDLLDCARRDLKVAKLLDGKELYGLAVYHVQQSVEKAAKAWALDSNFIDRSELRDVGHLSPMAFLRISDKTIGKTVVEVIKPFFPGTQEAQGLEGLIKNNSAQFARLPAQEVRKILDACTQLSEQLPEVLRKALPKIGASLLEIKIVGDDESSKLRRIMGEKYAERQKTDWPFRLISGMLGGILLYLLSVLTFPHESFTRYPDLEVKPSEYNESMGIVKLMGEVIAVIEKAIGDFSLSISET
jgi:HEPN domain-containing protein